MFCVKGDFRYILYKHTMNYQKKNGFQSVPIAALRLYNIHLVFKKSLSITKTGCYFSRHPHNTRGPGLQELQFHLKKINALIKVSVLSCPVKKDCLVGTEVNQ